MILSNVLTLEFVNVSMGTSLIDDREFEWLQITYEILRGATKTEPYKDIDVATYDEGYWYRTEDNLTRWTDFIISANVQ